MTTREQLVELVGAGLRHMKPTLDDSAIREVAQRMVDELVAEAENQNLRYVLRCLENSAISVVREPADAPDNFEDGWASIDGDGNGDGPSSLEEALADSYKAALADADRREGR